MLDGCREETPGLQPAKHVGIWEPITRQIVTRVAETEQTGLQDSYRTRLFCAPFVALCLLTRLLLDNANCSCQSQRSQATCTHMILSSSTRNPRTQISFFLTARGTEIFAVHVIPVECCFVESEPWY